MKRCSKCGTVKPLDEFYRQRSSRDGRDQRCKVCMREIGRRWGQANREREAARARAYRAKNPEAANAASKRYRDKNPEKRAAWRDANRERLRANDAAWRDANDQHKRAVSRAWRIANAERRQAAAKRRYLETREMRTAQIRAWREANPEKYREGLNRATARRRALRVGAFVEDVDRTTCYQMHGGRCGVCGQFIDLSAGGFHIDHITPLSRGGSHSYANTQPAHPACNLRKGDRLDYVPITSAL